MGRSTSGLARSAALMFGALAFVAGSTTAAPASAQAPLINTYGGPVGFGSNMLPINDDGSSDPIDLTAAFPGGLNFFGGPYTQVWVNNNGNITFSGPVFNYTPTPFPVADRPMIAPYWGDVDTRGGGTPNNNGVFYHLEPGRMVATWHNVGYYSSNDDRKMDFQLILTNSLDCRAGDFDVEFRYNRCEWTTGDASGGSGGLGGTPAQAGFDAGNSMDFVEIRGSRTMAILDVCTTSNVGIPGVWRFSVRGGEVSCPGTGEVCDTGMMGACGVGVTQCVGRDVVCSPVGTMSAERCNGTDDDCDGSTDEGGDLCSTAGDICVRGSCVPPCFEGGCGEGESCNADGICVGSACVDVTCPEGQRCRGGSCVGACDGIVCPHNQQCVAGRCTDLCDVLTCPDGELCVDGACVAQCPCRECDAGQTCLADGSCIDSACDIVTCDPGFYCEAGECRDACAGAVCPEGQRCQAGDCVDGPAPMADAGVPPGTGDGGAPPPPPGIDGGGMEDTDGGVDRRPPARGDPGCNCRAAGRDRAPSLAWLLAPLAFVLWRRRGAR